MLMGLSGKFLKSVVRDTKGPRDLAFIGNNTLPKLFKLHVTFLESECGGDIFIYDIGGLMGFKSLWESHSLRSKDPPAAPLRAPQLMAPLPSICPPTLSYTAALQVACPQSVRQSVHR